MSDDKNSQNTSNQETVTVTTEDPKKIEELEKQLAEKDAVIEDIKKKTNAEINEIKEKTDKIIKEIIKKVEIPASMKGKNSDDIAPGIRKTYTFEGGYRNAYETKAYKEKLAKAKLEQEKKNKSKRK